MEIEVRVGRVDLRWRNPTNYLRQVIKVHMEREKSSVIACAHVVFLPRIQPRKA